ncbi:hypothetical protein N7493_000978 [Penicillium malachiteum]|uniref:Methyltransferase type 12 domain-containing protein n=1 Tax=Penicillium malachiteum TaxID=1324776 RepID=A0AAD6HXB8_9EURO|nr:hypothetical protein N7493_000978 [Penicillium malachiteum]
MSSDTYVLIRDAAEAQRLERQYRAWQMNIGYLLHPAIEKHVKMRIADIGTGTAIWLRDLSGVLPETCQLHGFDISDIMFPNRAAMRANISLYKHNLLDAFPEKFIGMYDVVHVRLMIVALSFDQWEPAVRNLITLLRPGGYLQWADCAGHETTVKDAAGEITPSHAQHYLDLFNMTANAFGKTPNVAALYGIFHANNLQDCEEQIYPLVNPAAREDLNLAVLEGIQHVLIAGINLGPLDWIKSKDEILEARKAATDDLQRFQGWFSYNVHIVTGRKAR